jgi:hypothetical protein
MATTSALQLIRRSSMVRMSHCHSRTAWIEREHSASYRPFGKVVGIETIPLSRPECVAGAPQTNHRISTVIRAPGVHQNLRSNRELDGWHRAPPRPKECAGDSAALRGSDLRPGIQYGFRVDGSSRVGGSSVKPYQVNVAQRPVTHVPKFQENIPCRAMQFRLAWFQIKSGCPAIRVSPLRYLLWPSCVTAPETLESASPKCSFIAMEEGPHEKFRFCQPKAKHTGSDLLISSDMSQSSPFVSRCINNEIESSGNSGDALVVFDARAR